MKPEKLTMTTTESAKRYRKKLARAKPSARCQDPTIARLKWKKIYALMVAVRTHSVLTTMIVMGTKKPQKKTNSTESHHLHQLQRLKMPTLWTKPIARHRSSRDQHQFLPGQTVMLVLGASLPSALLHAALVITSVIAPARAPMAVSAISRLSIIGPATHSRARMRS